MSEPFQLPPAGLKQLTPFMQRANELRTADKVMAYWCCYYAAQLGISSADKANQIKLYLIQLLDTLEQIKRQLSGNDAMANETASSAYIENFALKVFAGADKEDRSGKATKATAKRFLAASNFIEIMNVFGPLEPEMVEKIKYAKWKATDIAKALREGRKPEPGPAGGDPKEEAAAVQKAFGGLVQPVDSQEEAEYLAREMAKLTAPDTGAEPQAISPGPAHEAESDPFQEQSRRSSGSKARMSLNLEGSPVASPNFSKPLQPQLPRAGSQSSIGLSPSTHTQKTDKNMWARPAGPCSSSPAISDHGAEVASSLPVPPQAGLPTSPGLVPGGRPLPVPPARDGLPVPPWSHSPSFLTSSPARLVSPGLPSAPSSPGVVGDSGFLSGAGLSSVPTFAPTGRTASPTFPTLPTAPSAPNAPVLSQPPAPASAVPETLSLKLSSRVQKLARSAASAVDFEDLDTARTQLRQALDILEGRTKE